MTDSNEIAVVHLVRAVNGIAPLKLFLESYQRNDGGIEHDLIVVMKGFGQDIETKEYFELLSSFECRTLNVTDIGLDITAYHSVIKKYSNQYRYFCFLNSYSVIQDKKWLKKMYTKLDAPTIGMVGASGSWHRVGEVRPHLSPMKAAFLQTYWREYKTFFVKRWLKSFISGMGVIRDQIAYINNIINFPKFPNYHIRTNGFMLSSYLLQQVTFPSVVTKMDAYKFESGRNSLTRQVLKRGLDVLVIGKDGKGYKKEAWCKSKTFWQAEQENLLITDNQTNDYKNGDLKKRNFLSYAAWGKHVQGNNE